KEAFVVSQAGRKGAVTISTNMAGRGTDIILGGNAEFMARNEVDPENAGKPGHELAPDKQAAYEEAFKRFKAQCDAEKLEVLAAGGLHILGTERHESRRIDNQLRGRAGRQGDPGSSRFYLSLEDDLMRIFGAERITGLMERLGMEEDVPIEHGLINRAIENAQKKVEGHNFDIRKNLLEYDDVMNQQRKTIDALRRQILEGRYAPEPSQEQKDRGITKLDVPPPTESGKFTTDNLAKAVRPILARMCDALSESRVADAEAPGGFKVETVPVNAAHLRSLIYREWGAYTDTKGVVEDRTAALDRLADDVASSLIQQRERLLDLSEQMIQLIIEEHCPPGSHAEDWDLEALGASVKQCFGFEPSITDTHGLAPETLAEMLWEQVERIIEARETEYPIHILLHYARVFYLEEIDERWIDHLKSMEALREGIHLRGYGQKDPKQEYKKEGFVIFGEMMSNIGRNVCEKLFHMQLQRVDAPAAQAQAPAPTPSVPPAAAPKKPRKTIESGGGSEAQAQAAGSDGDGEAKPTRRTEPKVGRNDPCPCGSGKKYKKCHGAGGSVTA